MSRVIGNKGRVVLVTDDPTYHEQMKSEIGKVAAWQLSLYTTDWPNYGTSYFDHLFRGQGCPIHYLQFENQK
jgi:tRNA G46 methylase TrmB